MPYAVASSNKKSTYHRTLKNAHTEYWKRYQKGDHEISITNTTTGDSVKDYHAKVVSPAKSNPSVRYGKFKGRTTHPSGGPITLKQQFAVKAYVGRKKTSRPRYMVGFPQGGTSNYINATKLSTAKAKGESYAKKRGWDSYWVQNQVTGSILQFKVVPRIPNGRMVPALIRHKGKTYAGKVKRVNGRVKIFVTPEVALKIKGKK
jgi:hypothetical protein